MIHDLVPLIIALLWPATILFLAVWFRKGIKDLIASVTEAKIGDSLVFKFGQAQLDEPVAKTLPSVIARQGGAPSSAKWENSASLFWLGNDLEWTAQTVLRGAPKERILHGLKQCNHHSSELDLGESAPGKQLSALKSQVEGLSEAALDRQWRGDFAEKIYSAIRGFDLIMKQHQPTFRSSP
jgi:hypothetical protein